MEYIAMDYCNLDCGICNKPVNLTNGRIVIHKDDFERVGEKVILMHTTCMPASNIEKVKHFFQQAKGVSLTHTDCTHNHKRQG